MIERSEAERTEDASFALREPTRATLRWRPIVVASTSSAIAAGVVAFLMHLSAASIALAPVACALLVVALGVAMERARGRRLERAAVVPRLILRADGLVAEEGGGERPILRVDRPFGVTLLATPARDLVVAALTHRDGVEYVAGRAPTGARHVDVLAHAITTHLDDLPSIHDDGGIPVFADGDRLLDLVATLLARSPGALDRVFLSDAGMSDLVLDGARLRAGALDFDLRAPLAWRGYSFQEGSTVAAHAYQATQIRQGDREVVLVSLAPGGELLSGSFVASHHGPLAAEAVQRAIARDLRLARGLADVPPPRSQRVAVDRLFMPRLRHALDLAPSLAERKPILTPSRGTPAVADHAIDEGMEHLRQSRP